MGGALAYVMRSPDFLVILIFAAVAWSAAPRRPYGEDPLTMTQGVTAVGAYVTLIALHVAAVFWCNNIYGGRLLETLF